MAENKKMKVVTGIRKSKSHNQEGIERLPYRLKNSFLTSTENALFMRLQELLEGRYVICPKVALNDLFNILRPNENVHFYNNFFRKHVDFLLCEPDDMMPAFGVEVLKTISKNGLRSSDQFMEDLFTSVGLPLVQIPSAEDYELADLVNCFQWAVMKLDETANVRLMSSDDSVPLCPECGLMMVLRMVRTGPEQGKKFYGCVNAPACKGVVPLG
jgi:hypothetical protein